eukprot:TRINITY_DN4308_c0_g1_i1.p1 TRINITY_DN4308_c0_g1~~TRINITY_DN4308_c0_g1_i1.p1  ORF type:complete len:376 (-),score=71.41 TRINITY_DN4308_c0_g1_i1:107-1234(-)
MYDSIDELLKHCVQDQGVGIGLGMIMYDYRCVPFDDIQVCQEMGLLHDSSTVPLNASNDEPAQHPSASASALHPIPVEFSLSPFENPRRMVEGRYQFDYFLNITDEDMLWFEIFFKLMKEKGNYKLANYVPSRVRVSLSTGDGSTVLVKGSKDTFEAHKDLTTALLSHKPRQPTVMARRSKLKSGLKTKEAPEDKPRLTPAPPEQQVWTPEGSASLRTRRGPTQTNRGGIKSLFLSKKFVGKIKKNAIQSRLLHGDVDPVPRLEIESSVNPHRRTKKLEATIARLSRPLSKDQQTLCVRTTRHEKALILPQSVSEDNTRLINLENAAAMLVDQHTPAHLLREHHLGTAEESHFQSKLKVVRHAGLRHARPIVKAI